ATPARRNDRFRGAAVAISNHWGAARLRFERHDAKVFFARKQQGPAAAKVVADDPVRLPAEKLHLPASEGPYAPLVLAAPDDDKRPTQPPARRHRQVDSLVRRACGNHQVKIFSAHWGGAVVVRIHGWVDHGAGPAVRLRDTPRHRLTNRDEMADARRRRAVPGAQALKQLLQRLPRPRAAR